MHSIQLGVSLLAAVLFSSTHAQSCSWLHQTASGSLYINLPSNNIARYPDAQTTWSKVAISGTPSTTATGITIDTSDFTFTSSSGLSAAHSVTRVPYGAAYGCKAGYLADGVTQIDLTGTPFAVKNGNAQFSVAGYLPAGTFSCASGNKQCTLKCGGYCGFCGPVKAMAAGEEVNRRGGAYLELDIVDQATFSTCLAAVLTPSCDWLQTSPTGQLYINLPSGNVARYPDAQTTYSKVAIAGFPASTASSITVDSSDFTYSTSSGLSAAHSVTRVPYGAAYGCKSPYLADGVTQIDLTGTPFAVKNGNAQFSVAGYLPSGSFACTSGNKQCTLRCGGYCGFCGPVKAMAAGEDANRRGGKYLELDVVDQRTFSYCVQRLPSCDWLTRQSGRMYVSVSSNNVARYPDAQTTWSKIAIGGTPTATSTGVTIDTSDFTFTSSSGLSAAHSVTRVPYGAAYGCKSPYLADGVTLIDLTGTPFAVKNGNAQFSVAGYLPAGTFSCTPGNKLCTLTCGGYCGFCGPVKAMAAGEDANRRGGAYLDLNVVDQATYSYCFAKQSAVSSAAVALETDTQSKMQLPNLPSFVIGGLCVLALQATVVAIVWVRRSRASQITPHVRLQELGAPQA